MSRLVLVEKVARVKLVVEEMNVHKIYNDLRRELTMGDKLSLCDNVTMVTGDPSRYLQEKNIEDELCPEGAWKKGASKMVVRYKVRSRRVLGTR